MKVTNKIAIELFVISSREDYPYIRDTLLPSLSKECGMGFVINGYVSLEKKEKLKPVNSTGAFFVYTDATKLPLSINKMVSESVVKLQIPAIFSTSKDPIDIKNQIYESIPQFSVYCETQKLLKKDYSSFRTYSFKEFQNLLLEDRDKTLYFFPCTDLYNIKTHGENLMNFIQSKVDTLSSKELVLTPHSLLNYFRDIPDLITNDPDNEFVLQFIKNWLFGVVNYYGEKELSFYLNIYENHFEKPLTDFYKNYLISIIPNYKEKHSKYTLELQGLCLSYTNGVSLRIKEITSPHIITDGYISIDSTDNNKIFNLTIDCNT